MVFDEEVVDVRVGCVDFDLGGVFVKLFVGARVTEMIEENTFDVLFVFDDTGTEVFIGREDDEFFVISKGL
jgi:hypothetical protein